MAESCPPGSPAQLSDGKVVLPEDLISFSDLCELVPLILETMAQSAQAAANGQPTPGAAVPIAGGSIFVPNGAAPVPTSRPGAIVGAPSGPMQQGGGTMGFGGGGGRGPAGPEGPRGPAGPGQILPIVKTDGNFTIASISPFVPIPGTQLSFNAENNGPAIFMVQAVFGGNSMEGVSNGQIGVRVDGTDRPLTANLIHTAPAGVGQFLASAIAAFPITLVAGPHTVELVVKGDSTLGAPTGNPLTVQANVAIPLALTVIHR